MPSTRHTSSKPPSIPPWASRGRVVNRIPPRHSPCHSELPHYVIPAEAGASAGGTPIHRATPSLPLSEGEYKGKGRHHSPSFPSQFTTPLDSGFRRNDVGQGSFPSFQNHGNHGSLARAIRLLTLGWLCNIVSTSRCGSVSERLCSASFSIALTNSARIPVVAIAKSSAAVSRRRE